jgi:eukaryotic-like serine/threonine-protein kinase
VIGNYRLLRTLGEGGFGRTYLAEHTILKKKVVIKQSLFKSAEAQRILLDEAGLLWDVNHWALPTVKDVLLTPEGDLLMVMTCVEGVELYSHVRQNGPLDIETVCWITQRVLSGLYYLHYAGIVHRDVKPANIIVNFKTHIATLVDFGLSKLRPDGTPDPSGYTPYFGSPEQVEGRPAIPESDIYSLGMTMLYVLGGDVTTQTLPDLPAPLRDYVSAMIQSRPLERPHDCRALNERLSEIRVELFGRQHTL